MVYYGFTRYNKGGVTTCQEVMEQDLKDKDQVLAEEWAPAVEARAEARAKVVAVDRGKAEAKVVAKVKAAAADNADNYVTR